MWTYKNFWKIFSSDLLAPWCESDHRRIRQGFAFDDSLSRLPFQFWSWLSWSWSLWLNDRTKIGRFTQDPSIFQFIFPLD